MKTAKTFSMRLAALVVAVGVAIGLKAAPEAPWPELTAESKPWTYWWWMGSAVEKTEITKNLELYSKAGLGGVHIIPVYGVKGWEDRYIDYLSPEWMEMFAWTVKEADRLGMGVDMSAGTGWPFGGPQIPPELAAKKVKVSRTGNNFTVKVEGTGQKVKRAAPGGEGLVMDPFSREALDIYLQRFDQAFEKTGARPRAFYNDSYEAYGADWTANLFEEFKNRRGYDLRGHLGALAGKGGKAALKKGEAGKTLVYLQLAPGQSLILRTLERGQAPGQPWQFFSPAGEPIVISGKWRIEFVEGGPELPDPVTISDLKSWTELGDQAKYFSGTARYRIEFNLADPAKTDGWVLELGKVHESARVKVNGKDAGVIFCHPFKLGIGEFLQPGVNRLELEVTNLAINRIIRMDQEKVKWKKFHDVNFPGMAGSAFDAAGWESFPSGLLGPVRLVPEKNCAESAGFPSPNPSRSFSPCPGFERF